METWCPPRKIRIKSHLHPTNHSIRQRAIPAAGLWIAPRTGHTINLEEPDAFNRAVLEFLTLAEQGRWGERDPRSVSGGVLGREE